MRITGGRAKGIILRSSDEKILRPATDHIRQAIFSSIANVVSGATFLDIFAGIGSYGLEAWSRGAIGGLFIENNSKISKALSINIAAVGKSIDQNNTCKIWHTDAMKYNLSEKFNLIFIDPPYDITVKFGQNILNKYAEYMIEDNNSRIIFEMPADVNLMAPQGLKEIKRIRKKNGKYTPSVSIFGICNTETCNGNFHAKC